MSIFFSAASMAGAFSGILAYAITKMDGIAGLEGWRWIFILEGAKYHILFTLSTWLTSPPTSRHCDCRCGDFYAVSPPRLSTNCIVSQST
jgi:MFS family permease